MYSTTAYICSIANILSQTHSRLCCSCCVIMDCVLLMVMAMVISMPHCLGIDIRYVSTGRTYHCCAHGDRGHGDSDDPGEPLILTPYIENNQILKGELMCRLKLADFAIDIN